MKSKSLIPAKLLLLSNLVLSGLIGLVLANIIVTHLQDRQGAPPSSVRTEGEAFLSIPERLATPKPASHFHQIVARDIFNTRREAETARPPAARNLEPTKLDLRLKGTVLGEGGPSYAVIQDGKTREQHVYRVGDVISGARVAGITWDDVILDVERKQEALRLEEKRATHDAPSPRKPSRKPAPRLREAPPPPPPKPRQ
jgi:type II secretory pathway component PulC